MKIVQLSDVHFGSQFRNDIFDKLIEESALKKKVWFYLYYYLLVGVVDQTDSKKMVH